MKNVLNVCFYLSIICFLSLCGCSNYTYSKSKYDSLYKVYKIDSINSYFVVYAEKAGGIYKIVSKKNVDKCKSKIVPDRYYHFELVSIWNQPTMINGVNVSPSITPNVTCLGFDDSTRICIERENSINDLYEARNLKGLCIIK